MRILPRIKAFQILSRQRFIDEKRLAFDPLRAFIAMIPIFNKVPEDLNLPVINPDISVFIYLEEFIKIGSVWLESQSHKNSEFISGENCGFISELNTAIQYAAISLNYTDVQVWLDSLGAVLALILKGQLLPPCFLLTRSPKDIYSVNIPSPNDFAPFTLNATFNCEWVDDVSRQQLLTRSGTAVLCASKLVAQLESLMPFSDCHEFVARAWDVLREQLALASSETPLALLPFCLQSAAGFAPVLTNVEWKFASAEKDQVDEKSNVELSDETFSCRKRNLTFSKKKTAARDMSSKHKKDHRKIVVPDISGEKSPELIFNEISANTDFSDTGNFHLEMSEDFGFHLRENNGDFNFDIEDDMIGDIMGATIEGTRTHAEEAPQSIQRDVDSSVDDFDSSRDTETHMGDIETNMGDTETYVGAIQRPIGDMSSIDDFESSRENETDMGDIEQGVMDDMGLTGDMRTGGEMGASEEAGATEQALDDELAEWLNESPGAATTPLMDSWVDSEVSEGLVLVKENEERFGSELPKRKRKKKRSKMSPCHSPILVSPVIETFELLFGFLHSQAPCLMASADKVIYTLREIIRFLFGSGIPKPLALCASILATQRAQLQRDGETAELAKIDSFILTNFKCLVPPETSNACTAGKSLGKVYKAGIQLRHIPNYEKTVINIWSISRTAHSWPLPLDLMWQSLALKVTLCLIEHPSAIWFINPVDSNDNPSY